MLAVRRRKANAGSLVDRDDRPIDEGPLVAMLHGQTRERFRLGFSLDHLRLRDGGRAIVQARDDVGQALFAAGSGMTDVVDALAALEAEADAIWAPRAAKHRTYTQAERSYEASRTVARDRQVRPRAWTEARDAHLAAEEHLRAIETERDALVAEQGRIERLRRIAPAMRRRAELLALLACSAETKAMPTAREERVVAALDVMAVAERERTAAAALLAEAQDRLEKVPEDDRILAVADVIDDLAERRGAVTKGGTDAARLAIERAAKQGRVDRLRADLKLGDATLPPKLIVARLRELAKAHGEVVAGLRAAAETEEDARARILPLERRLADAPLMEGLAELIAAVDAARRLGEDVDARHAASLLATTGARDAVAVALSRLAPWTGDVAELTALPTMLEDEIARAEADLIRSREAARLVADEIRRAEEELERIALERGTLAGEGHAVSASDLAGARGQRDALWADVREALIGNRKVPDAAAIGDAYRRHVDEADGVADRRFAFAADSGRLGLLDRQAAHLELRKAQATRRRDEALTGERETASAWNDRMERQGLPAVEPSRLRAWMAERLQALEDASEAARFSAQSEAEDARRAEVRSALLELMPDWHAPDDRLAPVLVEAERRRADGEARTASYRQDHAELRQLSDTLADLTRANRRRGDDRVRFEVEWRDIQARIGTPFAIADGDRVLGAVDELRTEMDAIDMLDARMRGIEADRQRFETEVAELWRRVGGDGEGSLDALRARLAAARSASGLRDDLTIERDRRSSEMEAAAATRTATVASLKPVLDDLGGIGVEELDGAVQASRRIRADRDALAIAVAEITAAGDGFPVETLEAQWIETDPDAAAARSVSLVPQLADANSRVTAAAEAASAARIAFSSLDVHGDGAAAAAAEAEEARAEMGVQAEAYLLRRSQAVTLRWAIERHRRERQDPLLARAGGIFARLTLGRYTDLRIDYDAATPRLLGVTDGGRRAIDVDAMSDGTADQLFLALRLAAAEQSVAAGSRLPFLADDLFINFDDDRARAGFEVLAELATSTQVLFFTHHAHLADLAGEVVGADLHSRCDLEREDA